MPKKSGKSEVVEYLIEVAATKILCMEENASDDDENHEDSVDQILDELNEDLECVLVHRRSVETTLPKSIDWRENVFTNLSCDRFRQMMRVDRMQFNDLVSLIRDDEEFLKPHSSKQFSIELQLAIILFRLGSSGESASVRKIASIFGIGDGGTLANITHRIFTVFLKMLPKYIFWPSSEERSEIVVSTYEELPFCIGYIDGSEFKLAEAPLKNHETFYSRSHIYSVKAQAVYDYNLKFRDVVVGSPGSTHDAKIFRNSKLFKENENFFSSQQWIAGDSAYPLSNFVITPYRANSPQLELSEWKAFNLRHSRYRVRVEHSFGLLKEKFCSLKELRMRIGDKKSHKFCCEWIMVCCILHNILLTDTDIEMYINSLVEKSSDSMEHSNSMEEDESENSTPNKNFEAKRQGLYYFMFP